MKKLTSEEKEQLQIKMAQHKARVKMISKTGELSSEERKHLAKVERDLARKHLIRGGELTIIGISLILVSYILSRTSSSMNIYIIAPIPILAGIAYLLSGIVGLLKARSIEP